MKTKRNTNRLSYYGPVALVILVASIGLAAIIYGANIIPFNILNIPAWIFCPLGAYTIIYSLATRKDSTYYLIWGSIMFTIGLISATYNIVNPLIIVGALLVIIAIISIISHQRGKR